jgi:hypothetical protein
MHQVKNFFDLCFGTLWGVNLIKILPLIMNTGTAVVFPQLDKALSITITVLGIAYAIARLIITIRKAKQDERFREQEIIEKQNSNFLKKWNDEFIEPKK